MLCSRLSGAEGRRLFQRLLQYFGREKTLLWTKEMEEEIQEEDMEKSRRWSQGEVKERGEPKTPIQRKYTV